MKSIATILLIVISFLMPAQIKEMDTLTKTNKKFIAWVSPSKATHVYGLMFNCWPKDSLPYPKIYGAEFNICPIGIFAPFIIAVHSLDFNALMKITDTKPDSANFKTFKTINGLQLGFINLEPTIINGIDINASGSLNSITNGTTISITPNFHYLINGVTLSVMGNFDYKCIGIQIGLFNSCANLKGIQFGLWNKNQKRSMPFINWCFKTKKSDISYFASFKYNIA